MPTPELMTWVPSQRRWTIRYMGKRYYVSCRQLAIKPETKEASIQAANAWWREKQASIDLAYRAGQQARSPGTYEQLPSIALGGNGDLLETLQGIVSEHFADPPPVRDGMVNYLAQMLSARIMDHLIASGRLPEILEDNLPPARSAQIDRGIKELHGEQAAEPDKTVSALVQHWLDGQRVQVTINGISPARFAGLSRLLPHFAAHLGGSADVSTINAESLEAFYNFCLSRIAEKQWSRARAQQIFAVARQWIDWLAGRGIIPLPANFRRRWRFGPSVKKIETWPVEDVRRAVNAAEGKLKLCLLLMLNCGMTQKDVSDLKDREVNWRDGRLIRKRSKTGHLENVPVVNYKLWPSTFALLKECRSGKDTVLLTYHGNPYINRRLEGDRVRMSDGFGLLLGRLLKKIGIKRPLKQLRKTAATLLESHEVYGRFDSYFLGHAARSMADKHYSAPSQELFDKAVTWLGEQLGVDR